MPRSVLFVLHVEEESGPQRSLTPRLELLRSDAAQITTLVPAPGPAADRASRLGDVWTGVPGALQLPRGLGQAVRMPASMIHQARHVESAARRLQADLVIVSSALTPGALAGARRSGASTLLYGGEYLPVKGLAGRAREAVGRYSASRADEVLVPSRLVAAWYERNGRKAVVIPPPVVDSVNPSELAATGVSMRERLGVAPDDRLVCSLGAITEGRGQDLLVRALARSRARGESWRLVIAGQAYPRRQDLAYESALRALVDRLGLTEHVLFPGRISDPYAFFAAMDLFVNPARIQESFGRAACEALLSSCPVISARVGGVSEALIDGETAILVEPESVEEIGDSVTRLLADPELAATLAERGREDVKRRFHPKTSEGDFLDAVSRSLHARESRKERADLSLQPGRAKTNVLWAKAGVPGNAPRS